MKRDDRSTHSTPNFFMMIEERAGRMTAAAFCTVSLWFFLAHTAVFARLWAELLRAYLAQGALAAALCVLPILAGIAYLGKGQGFYIRAGRYLEFVLLMLSAGFVWFAGSRAPAGWLQDGAAYPKRLDAVFPGMDSGRWELVAALFLLGGFFFAVVGGIRGARASYDYLYPVGAEFCRRQTVDAIRERFRDLPQKVSGIFAADTDADAGYTDAVPTDGVSGRSARENGMITQTVKLYGAEFADELSASTDEQKVRFCGIKTTKRLSDLPYTDKISRYGERVAAKLTVARIWWWVAVLAVYALTVGFADALTAVAFYRAYNLQIFVPVMLIFSVVVAAIARGKGADKKMLQWRK